MKRKPDILVVLAALLGLGIVFSSLNSVTVAEIPAPAQQEQVVDIAQLDD